MKPLALTLLLCLLAFAAISDNMAQLRRGFFSIMPWNDPMMECVLDKTPGCSDLFKYGANSSVGTTEEDIWDQGGTYAGYPTSAVSLRCDSTSASDASGGTGATLVRAVGLDDNWLEKEEIFIPTGTTAVVLDGLWTRLFRVQAITAGSNGNNVGTIFCEETLAGDGSASADDYAQILPDNGSTLMAIYTVPAGKTGVFVNATFSVARGDDAELAIWARSNVVANGAWILGTRGHAYQGQWTLSDNTMGAVNEMTDIRLAASAGTGAIDVKASFMVYLFDN